MTTVLVTGSRDWTDRMLIFHHLKMVQDLRPGPYTLIQGGCRGADCIASEAATSLGWKVETLPVTPAEWKEKGRGAGPERNQAMIDRYQPQIAICFRLNMSLGSSDCLEKLYTYKKRRGTRLNQIVTVDV